jgi:hypothetical protein
MFSPNPPAPASVKPSAMTALKTATSAMFLGSVAKSAAVGTGLHFKAAAFALDHALPEARARAEQEYCNGVECQADRPAAERPEMPGVLRAELAIDREECSD